MVKPVLWVAQGLLYAFFALILGYFSDSPPYRHLAADQALIKLSFSLHSKLVSDCRQRSAEELARLPRNMRAPMDCKRERSAVIVEIDLDGIPAYRHVGVPPGLSKDGPSSVYHRFPVTAGLHRITVRLSDDARAAGFNYTLDQKINLEAGKVLVIDFNAAKGGFILT